MRIAIVVNTSWNIYNFRLNFVKTLIANGHEVHTIAPKDEFTNLLIKEGCIHHSVKMDSRGTNPIKDAALILRLFFTYLRIKPAIVLHYTIKPNVYGTLAASLLRIPSINNVCGLGTVFLKDDIVSSFAMFLYKKSFCFAKKVFFQNQEDLQLFLDKKLVPAHLVDLLPGSGIDLERFAPLTFTRNKKFTFLLISRLIIDKGIMEYIEAIRKLKGQGLQARFQLLGAMDSLHKRGIRKEVVKEWIESGVVEYLGTTNDVQQFIRQADCIVLPSYREGTPRSLLEAASSSKPIIATNVPGCKQVVENNYNGLLCNMKDADDLAEKMKCMAGLSDNLLRKMGVNGRTKVEAEYSENIVIDKYIQAINRLLFADKVSI